MLKVDYLGFKLDEVYRLYGEPERFEAIYLGGKTLFAGVGAKPESACAAAQRKIQKHVRPETN
jgi:hypothetical protein